jgi:Asp-tRNA(Asn)/Glu-tRNA(Gln) amidotransferase A subunit family amidase
LYLSMAGVDVQDSKTKEQPTAHVANLDQIHSFKDVRIGVFTPYFEDADPIIVRSCREALKKLEAVGAQIVEIEIPRMNAISKAHTLTVSLEMVRSSCVVLVRLLFVT